jgi:hypothetical protein
MHRWTRWTFPTLRNTVFFYDFHVLYFLTNRTCVRKGLCDFSITLYKSKYVSAVELYWQRRTQRKNLAQWHFVHHESHMDCHGNEPRPRGEKPEAVQQYGLQNTCILTSHTSLLEIIFPTFFSVLSRYSDWSDSKWDPFKAFSFGEYENHTVDVTTVILVFGPKIALPKVIFRRVFSH